LYLTQPILRPSCAQPGCGAASLDWVSNCWGNLKPDVQGFLTEWSGLQDNYRLLAISCVTSRYTLACDQTKEIKHSNFKKLQVQMRIMDNNKHYYYFNETETKQVAERHGIRVKLYENQKTIDSHMKLGCFGSGD
jgi:hypothetical protein